MVDVTFLCTEAISSAEIGTGTLGLLSEHKMAWAGASLEGAWLAGAEGTASEGLEEEEVNTFTVWSNDTFSDSGVVWDRLAPGSEGCLFPVRVSVLDLDAGLLVDLCGKEHVFK